jgi:hypothetical protein
MLFSRSKSRRGIAPTATRKHGRTGWRPALETLECRTLLSFNAPINYPGPGDRGFPNPIVTADFRGNGVTDLAVLNRGGGEVVTFLGNGDGTFQPAHTTAVGPNAFAIAIADLAHTGHADLVVTHYRRSHELGIRETVSVLRGNGDGTFQAPVDYQVGEDPASVAIGDFNGDGVPDIVVADFGHFNNERPFNFIPGMTVNVLLGNGDGTFQSAQTFDTGVAPEAVAVGDFAGDGRLSIVTADELDAGGVSFLQGNGDGTFQSPLSLDDGVIGVPRSLAVADLTGNGIPDIVSVADTPDHKDRISVFLGRGDNTFQNAATFPATLDPRGSAGSVVVGDFAGNGKLDVAVTSPFGTGESLFILLGNGDGSFQLPIPTIAGNTFFAAAGNFDGGVAQDLAVTNEAGVGILLAQPGGLFNTPQTFAAGAGANFLVTDDFTGTGVPGLVTANSSDDSVSVLLGNGDGTFQAAVNYAVGSNPQGVAVADLTGNGIKDLVVANAGEQTLSVLRGNGDGTFRQAQTITLTFDDNYVPVRVAAIRFAGDANLDLVVLAHFNQLGSKVARIAVLRGNGDGTFSQDPNLIGVPAGDLVGNYTLAVADFTRTGKSDLIVNSAETGVYVLLGNGDGTFKPAQMLHAGPDPASVAVGDLRGNGILDLVVADDEILSPGHVSVLLGNGNGTFQPAMTFTAGRGANSSVVLGDFFGDGVLGMAISSLRESSVLVLRGNGDGTFGPPTSYLAGAGPVSLVAGNFHGAGAPDLAYTLIGPPRVGVILNRNDGLAAAKSPQTAITHVRPSVPESVLAQVTAPTLSSASVALSSPAASSLLVPLLEANLAALDRYFAAPDGEEFAALVSRLQFQNPSSVDALWESELL